MSSCRLIWIIICCLLTASLSACMVGPNFHRPRPPNVTAYNEKPLPGKTATTKISDKGGNAQYFLYNEDLPADWWRLFRSSALNRLVKAGIANNPNLLAAQAALKQAKENLNAKIGSTLLPAFNGQAYAQRNQVDAAGFGTVGGSSQTFIYNLFNTQINVSYTLDIFGGLRRQVEVAQAQMDYQRFALLATYITLASNIVTTAITIASLEAQIAATKDLIKSELYQLKILRGQFRLGGIAESDVLTQETFAQQTIADLPVLQKTLSQNKHALTTLLGIYPNSSVPRLKLEDITLPARIPISLPCNLVRQRPDILQSEALLHAASAQIGVATANLLPQLNITGDYGWIALIPNQLFGPSTNIWTITNTLTQPLFQGGALFAQRRAAIAAYQQASMQYRQTLLQAFQNVGDSLRAIETDSRTLRAQTDAERAAKQALYLAQEQFKLGGINYIALLIAQQQYQQARIRQIQAQAGRYTNTAALYQALGGGWWESACRICKRQQFVSRKIPGNCSQCSFEPPPHRSKRLDARLRQQG